MLKTSHALVLLIVAVLALAGCATQGATAGMQPVPITDFKMVAGKWAGPVTGITSRDDWAEMTITPEGRFDFGIARTIGVFEGGGPLTLADGKMQGKGARGSIVYTLYEGGNRRVLKGDATLSDGRQVSATLTPR